MPPSSDARKHGTRLQRPQRPESPDRPVRSPREHGKHPSQTHPRRRNETGANSNSETGRDRHWNTVLGSSSGDQSKSKSSFSSADASAHSKHSFENRRHDALSHRPKSSGTGEKSSKGAQNIQMHGVTYQQSRTPPPKPFACKECEHCFERKGHLEEHSCDYPLCGRTFSHRSSLSRHIKGIHEKKRFRERSKSPGPPPSGS